ncbi:uncharacterized protein isoform X2 [Danio rerio]|uniref:Uncharacterized protein isoform X2 n=1 Tax=Danio rerio TaxID=7955 RepID=A0AC58G2G6_DANRE
MSLIQLVLLLGIIWRTWSESHRFILIEQSKNWDESQKYCRKAYEDLATVQGPEDRVKLQQAADAAGFTSFAWIGFYNGVLKWRWSFHNEDMGFSSWASWEPNMPRTQEACVFMNERQEWSDTSCFEQKQVLCQTADKPTVRRMQLVRVAVKTDGSLQESAMMEVIEKQMNLMLSEQKMNTDSNITWRIQSDGKILRQDTNDTHGTTAAVCEHINPVES